MKELNETVKRNVARIKRLGTYSGDTLAKGFYVEQHQDELNDLLDYLGQDFPIPVLEMAVKTMRSKLEGAKREILEQMYQADIDAFTMEGNAFEMKTEYNASFPLGPDGEPDKQQFFQWLIDHDRGHSVKSTIDLPKIDEAERAKEVLREAGLNVSVNRTMHGNTLKALVKELMKIGEEVPTEVIDIRPVDILSIKKK